MVQTVVITGASAGIGRAAARLFGARGAQVGLIARGEEGLRRAAEDVTAAGGIAHPVSADVADFGQVDAAAGQIEKTLGPIDVWVNVAFTSVFAPFAEITAEEFRRVTEVAYLGFVHGTMAALARMRPRDRGVIVQVGSALGERSIPLQSAYCGAKHAINGFTSSLRCELLHEGSGVRVTVVQMPAVNTPQFSWVRSRLPRHPQPVPPIYQPEVAARGIVRAADHPGRRQYLVGASTRATILANRVLPGLLDRYLARTGYGSQQTSEPEPPGKPDNLWQPRDEAPGTDHGAHGEFDSKAHPRKVLSGSPGSALVVRVCAAKRPPPLVPAREGNARPVGINCRNIPERDAVTALKYVPGKYGRPAASYLPVAALYLVTTSAGIRPRSLISMSCARAHSRISAAFRPPAGALRPLRAGRRPLARDRRAAPAYCASASRKARACSALRSISYSAPSSPKRTVPSASLPSMSSTSRV